MSELESELALQFRLAKLPPWECEFEAIPGRKFRFDFAFVPQGLLIEVQGGVWGKRGQGGPAAHSGGMAANRDAEKANLATLRGWRVLQLTVNQIRSGQALRWVQEALDLGGIEK